MRVEIFSLFAVMFFRDRNFILIMSELCVYIVQTMCVEMIEALSL